MQKSFIDTAVCRDEQGSRHTFHYYLTIEEIPAGSFTYQSFGIRIEEDGGESMEMRSITPNRTRLERLMALLIRNAVTPIDLAYVVQDWLDSFR